MKDGVLLVRSADGAVQHEAAIGEFRAVSSLRLDPRCRSIALTGVTGAGREPEVSANQRGDLRLHVIDLATGARRCLTNKYAHDAVWWPDGSRLAYHTGQGIAVVRVEDGGEEHRFDVGRFGWGPPSISVSPSGTRVAFVKWKGDDRKMAVYWARHEGGRLADRGLFYVGEHARGVPEGFRPLPTIAVPEFGFHALPR